MKRWAHGAATAATLAGTLASSGPGCSCAGPDLPDAGVGAPIDTSTPVDGGPIDAPRPDDVVDLGVADVPSLPDTPDAPTPDTPACDCPPVACQSSDCSTGICQRMPLPDGAVCLDPSGDGVCAAAVCVPRPVVCGDGVRASSEACDDGNLDPGDACDAACMPTAFSTAEPMGVREYPPAAHPGVAVDGDGLAAFVWTAAPLTGRGSELRLRMYDAGGVPASAAPYVVIARDLGVGVDPHPTIAGLPAGWVVAWEDSSIDPTAGGLAYVIVAADGTFGAPRALNSVTTASQTDVALATTPTGFVASWTDSSGVISSDPIRVVFRQFDASGAPLGADQPIDSEARRGIGATVAAASDGSMLFAWIRGTRSPVEPTQLSIRRHSGTAFVDGAPLMVDGDQAGSATATALDGGGFALAWTAAMTGGDIRALVVPSTGAVDAALSLPIAVDPSSVGSPAIVALGGASFLVSWGLGGPGGPGAHGVAFAAVPAKSLPDLAVPTLGDLETRTLGRWTFARGFAPQPAGPDVRIWASFGHSRFIAGMGTVRTVGGYLFAPEWSAP